jgi:DNA polymerase-3 subunit epsilon
MRHIVLDTETTGIGPEHGHRIIEIAALELVDLKETGRFFHSYLNPGREIDANASEVHGITGSMLVGKEAFPDIAREFIDFIRGAELLIHHAPFDVGFINHELSLMGPRAPARSIEDVCTVIDTRLLARKQRPRKMNDLASLCKHYGIETRISETRHAFRDAKLLMAVYLAMKKASKS